MPLTNTGLEYILKDITGLATSNFVYMAIGSGSTAFTTSNTTLANENTLYGSARKAATCSFVSPATARWTALFSFTGDVTVREIGLFDAASGGHMLYRRVLSANESYHDGGSMEYTVDITLTRA